jgi:hypothetical protein
MQDLTSDQEFIEYMLFELMGTDKPGNDGHVNLKGGCQVRVKGSGGLAYSGGRGGA